MQDGDRFWRMPEAYIRGNTVKYLRVPDEVCRASQALEHARACWLAMLITLCKPSMGCVTPWLLESHVAHDSKQRGPCCFSPVAVQASTGGARSMASVVQVIDKVKEESATKAGEQADWKRCLAPVWSCCWFGCCGACWWGCSLVCGRPAEL